MIASSLRHSIHTLRRRTSSSVSLAINGVFLLLAWTFLPLENAQWHAVMSRRAVLFPQIDFKRLKPLDGLRMFVQSVYLLFFYITDEPLVSSRLDQDHAAHDSLLRRAGIALRNAGLSLRGFIAAKGEALTEAFTSRIASWHQTRTQTAQNKSFRREWLAAAFFTLIAATLGWLCITQPLDLWNQTIFLMATVSIALFVRHIRSHFTFLLLIVLSTLVSARYMWWRWTQTLNLDSTAGTVCSILLVLAETYAFVVMLLGYFQTFWVLDRPPVPMPRNCQNGLMWTFASRPTTNRLKSSKPLSTALFRWTGRRTSSISGFLTTAAVLNSAPSPKLPASATSSVRSTTMPRPATSTMLSG